MTNKKSIKSKPQFYAVCFTGLQKIAKKLGYNLLIHGSMNRDMDIVAVPWIDKPSEHIDLLNSFSRYLGVMTSDDIRWYNYSILPGGRHSYIINLNRGGIFNGYVDEQYYLDISITPLVKPSMT
jgi:hypothetical protein